MNFFLIILLEIRDRTTIPLVFATIKKTKKKQNKTNRPHRIPCRPSGQPHHSPIDLSALIQGYGCHVVSVRAFIHKNWCNGWEINLWFSEAIVIDPMIGSVSLIQIAQVERVKLMFVNKRVKVWVYIWLKTWLPDAVCFSTAVNWPPHETCARNSKSWLPDASRTSDGGET